MKLMLPIILAAVLASGCASTAKQELSRMEQEGSGKWQMTVRSFPGETMTGFLIWRHDKEKLSDNEQLVIVATSEWPQLLSSPFKNLITMLVKAKRSLALEKGDVVIVDKPFQAKDTKYLPDIEAVLCRTSDSACIDKASLGLVKPDGEVTVGPYIWLPF